MLLAILLLASCSHFGPTYFKKKMIGLKFYNQKFDANIALNVESQKEICWISSGLINIPNPDITMYTGTSLTGCRVFPTGAMGQSNPHQPKICSSPTISPLPPPPKVDSPLNNNFHVITQKKLHFEL